MNQFHKKQLIAIVAIVCCCLLNPGIADEYRTAHHQTHRSDSPDANEMMFDALIIRPISLITTVAGSAIYVVSLPFSLPGGNEREARETLVYEPARYTFKRPLGKFPADHHY